MNPLRATMADIGRQVGVSIATVSLALRNNPRIASETRARIQQAAVSLGYRPDPLLSALVARRHSVHTSKTSANLAVLIDEKWKSDTSNGDWLERVLVGARTACLHSGYGLDELYIGKDFATRKDPDLLLSARGIRGLVIPSLTDGRTQLEFNWSDYAIVALGGHPADMPFHRVGTNFFTGMGLACSELCKLGYQRVGLAHSYQMESSHRFEWVDALGTEAHIKPKRLVVVPAHLPPRFTKASYLRWIRKYKPQCVLSNEPESIRYLQEAGMRIPEDIGVVSLSPFSSSEMVSGLIPDYGLLGEICIDHLHGSLLRGELGVPRRQRETLICSDWSPGNTLCKHRPEYR